MTTSKSVPVDPALAATPEEVKSFRAQQEEEWGQYVAAQTITYGGAIAYLPGDPVPASNVKRHGYEKDGLVHKTGGAEARKLAQALQSSAEPIDVGAPVSLSIQAQ